MQWPISKPRLKKEVVRGYLVVEAEVGICQLSEIYVSLHIGVQGSTTFPSLRYQGNNLVVGAI